MSFLIGLQQDTMPMIVKITTTELNVIIMVFSFWINQLVDTLRHEVPLAVCTKKPRL